jgi:hypothetical protein
MSKPRVRLWQLTSLASLLLLIFSNISLHAQGFEPATSGFTAEIRVWTSGGNTYAKVRLTFPNLGYRVSDWGQIVRSGNSFTADAKVERYMGASGQAIMFKENTYTIGALQPGLYTFTFKSYGVTIKTQQFDPAQVEERWERATLSSDRVGIRVMTASDTRTLKVEFYFPDTGYAVTDWGQIMRSGNDFSVDVKADRWTGESAATTVYVDHDYQMGTLAPGSYTITVKIYGSVVKTQPFSVNASSPRLLTEESSERAIALDSVTWLRLFPLVTTHNFSPDRRARLMLLVADVDWSSEVNLSAVTAQAEDAQHKIYPLTVEYVGKVPNFDWLTQVVVKPPDELKSGGDVWVTINVRGAASNRAMVTLKPSDASTQ